MGKASERKKQKRREKQRRKRKQAKDQTRAKSQVQLPTSERGLVKLASVGEFGPAWIGEGWDSPGKLTQVVPRMLDEHEHEHEFEFEWSPEPPEGPWYRGDAGEDPNRIDWRAACTGVPWLHPMLVEHDSEDELEDTIETFVWELETDRYRVWESVIRQEQGLSLSPEHVLSLGELLGQAERMPLIDDMPRPCEPWYQVLDRLLDLLIVERIETVEAVNTLVLSVGPRLLDAVEAHAGPLSLPSGVESFAELLADERISRVRAQSVLDALAGLGQAGDDGRPMSLAGPSRAFRVDMFVEGLQA